MSVTKYAAAFAFAMTLVAPVTAWSEETVSEKVQSTTRKGVDNTKEAGRNMSDKVCEMVNGKEKCVYKKMKHKAQNMTDDVSTKAKEVKDKVD